MFKQIPLYIKKLFLTSLISVLLFTLLSYIFANELVKASSYLGVTVFSFAYFFAPILGVLSISTGMLIVQSLIIPIIVRDGKYLKKFFIVLLFVFVLSFAVNTVLAPFNGLLLGSINNARSNFIVSVIEDEYKSGESDKTINPEVKQIGILYLKIEIKNNSNIPFKGEIDISPSKPVYAFQIATQEPPFNEQITIDSNKSQEIRLQYNVFDLGNAGKIPEGNISMKATIYNDSDSVIYFFDIKSRNWYQ